MPMLHTIAIFTTLRERLASFGEDETTARIIADAVAENGWFTRRDVLQAVDAIRSEMLTEEYLTAWLSRYKPTHTPKRVAVVMAGNIPLVGFFDLLCVIAAGHTCCVKPSSKDRVLMHYVIGLLREIEPAIRIEDYNATDHYDMAIATGGDSANAYFREHFASTRTLLRGSRHSIAILDGTESREELRGLYTDITSYSGLGCRSVSMLFVPRGYTPKFECQAAHNPKLQRNVQSMRATLTIEGVEHHDCGAFVMCKGDKFSNSLAVVTLREYDDIEDVRAWISDNKEVIQCVVSHRDIAFGRAQYPALTDYADGVDTMRFLLG